ncbi:MAG: hypothetical protein AAFQ98_23610, partial [Bacteroidota bacterium]
MRYLTLLLTLGVISFSSAQVSNFPYVNGFETRSGFTFHGTNSSWTYADEAFFTARTGAYFLTTQNYGAANASQLSYAISP